MNVQHPQMAKIDALGKKIDAAKPVLPYDFKTIRALAKKTLYYTLLCQIIILLSVSLMVGKVLMQNPLPAKVYTQSTDGHLENITVLGQTE